MFCLVLTSDKLSPPACLPSSPPSRCDGESVLYSTLVTHLKGDLRIVFATRYLDTDVAHSIHIPLSDPATYLNVKPDKNILHACIVDFVVFQCRGDAKALYGNAISKTALDLGFGLSSS
jgi:hypothetical protein